jgi:hypothetical protein
LILIKNCQVIGSTMVCKTGWMLTQFKFVLIIQSCRFKVELLNNFMHLVKHNISTSSEIFCLVSSA